MRIKHDGFRIVARKTGDPGPPLQPRQSPRSPGSEARGGRRLGEEQEALGGEDGSKFSLCAPVNVEIAELQGLRDKAGEAIRKLRGEPSDDLQVVDENEAVFFCFKNPYVAALFEGYCRRNRIPNRSRTESDDGDTIRVDTWTPDGESIVEHIAGVEDYQVALASYRAACERWPGIPITLRQGAASDRGQPAPARGVQSVRVPRVIEDSRRLRAVSSQ